MIDNIEYSEDWLLAKKIEIEFKAKQTGKEKIITIKEKDLYNLVLEFIKINKRGG